MCASLVLADLGFASTQIDDPARGMSFRADGPLDMRMDPSLRTTAADLVASLPENELARIVRELGEERHAARVARAIIEARRVSPLVTTTQFAEVVRRVVPRQAGGIDPATRTFQALRIAVNDELGVLDAFLSGILRRTEQIVGGLQEGAGEVAPPASRGWLAPGGRVAIISFHSLEDRLVKKAFQAITRLGGRELSGKSVAPTEEELRRNPRSRSAKLRAVQLPSGSV
jgi:16S rRNA (cytosine1402-N4)-methyltransferase